jgi:hypothetical protein
VGVHDLAVRDDEVGVDGVAWSLHGGGRGVLRRLFAAGFVSLQPRGPVQRLGKKDAWWLLAFPVYLLVGTARHEASHALAGVWEGVKLERFVIWPSYLNGHYAWGYVQWSGQADWVVVAAPYLCDLLTFVGFFFVCTRLPLRSHGIWVNLVILGLVSPWVNSAYAYARGVMTPPCPNHEYTTFLCPAPTNDVTQTLIELPAAAVHSYFAATLVLYTLGLLLITTRPPYSQPAPSPH